MAFFSPESPEQIPLTGAATGEVASFWDTMQAAATASSIDTNYWDQEGRTRRDIIAEITTRMGPDAVSKVLQSPVPRFGQAGTVMNGVSSEAGPQTTASVFDPMLIGHSPEIARNLEAKLFEALLDLQAQDPSQFGDLTINSIGALDDEVVRRRRAEYQDAQDTLAMGGRGSSVAEFLGGAGVAMTDEYSLPLMFLGGTGSVARVVLTEAALGGLGEAAILPRMYDQAETLDIPNPDPVSQIGLGMVLGGGLGGGIAAAGRFIQYRRNRNQTQTDGSGDTVASAIEAEVLARETEQALQNGDPIPVGQAGSYVGGSQGEVAFVQAMMPAAIAASARTGVDPRIIIAQAVQETGWGRHAPNNNYFGIKSHGESGGQVLATTEVIDGQSVNVNSSFRAYDDMAASVDGYADFLLANPRYREMMQATDIDAQIAALGRSGYATDPNYANSIARIAANISVDGVQLPVGQRFRPTGGGADIPQGTRAGYTTPDQVVTPGGQRIDVAYEVVDASLLTRASGDLQPRDRSRAASAAQINEISARLDPARLMPSAEADRGAPIIGPDNIIESGNGRVAAILQAAPDRQAAYRSAIGEAGFDIPAGMENPVLVARRTSDLDAAARIDFVNSANTSAIARLSATEQARMDARALNNHTMDQFVPGKALDSADNATFSRAFLARLPENERASLTTAQGRINIDGQRRMKQALFARAYGAPDLIAKHAEASDPAMRSLIDALAEAAPAWSALRAAVDEGRIKPELDITDNLLDAVRLIGDARKSATKGDVSTAGAIDDALAQIDLDGAVHPLTEALVQVFRKGDRVRPDREITELLNGYVSEAHKVGKTDAALFDDTLSSGSMEVLNAIQRETDLFAPGGPGTRPGDPDLYRQPGRSGFDQSGKRTADPIDISQVDPETYKDGAQSEGSVAIDEQLISDLRNAFAEQAPDQIEISRQLSELKERQPFDNVDELFARKGDEPSLIEASQAYLTARGREVSEATGVAFKDPGHKIRETVEEKLVRKQYSSARQLTDTARGGFLLNSIEDADKVISALRETSEILDEHWGITPTGYFDRKILMRTENGVIAEIQLWHREMFEAKKSRGSELYTMRRAVETSPEMRIKLAEEEQALYAAVLRSIGVDRSKLAGISNTPNSGANRAFSASTEPRSREVSPTSNPSTDTQSPPGSSKAIASPRAAENSTAGLASQSVKNTSDISNTSNLSLSTMRREVNEIGDFEITVGDQTYRASEILDDLEADQNLADVINLCNPKGGA